MGLIQKIWSRKIQRPILAVLGANDYADNAAPSNDGWFFSDFFPASPLLKPVAEDQRWLFLMCRAKGFSQKNGSYVQGNPLTDNRKIVLDASMLTEVADIEYVPKKKI